MVKGLARMLEFFGVLGLGGYVRKHKGKLRAPTRLV